MILKDRIYGTFKTKEPIVKELIESKQIQRLKKISQFGLPDKYYHIQGFSRYEHSIGVMILLNKLGANLEEQIAGLLHDISHYAFSHIADWTFGSQTNEDLQDSIHMQSFKKGEIHQILKKYGYKPDRIAKLENYKILDKEIPELCADRIDYSLREFKNHTTKKNLNFCLKSLITYNNEIIFTNKKAAQIFARTFIKCQIKHWAGYEAVCRYKIMADILKKALLRKIISKKYFLTDDWAVINKLLRSNDKDLVNGLQILKKKKINPKIVPQWKTLKKKFRYVDPKYLEDEKVYLLSKTDSTFADLIRNYKAKSFYN